MLARLAAAVVALAAVTAPAHAQVVVKDEATIKSVIDTVAADKTVRNKLVKITTMGGGVFSGKIAGSGAHTVTLVEESGAKVVDGKDKGKKVVDEQIIMLDTITAVSFQVTP